MINGKQTSLGLNAPAKRGRQWLHLANWAGYFAYPVQVLSRGACFSRVKLLHQTRIGRTTYPAGTIKYRVPNDAIAAHPNQSAYVSQGGGRFRPINSRRGASAKEHAQ